MRRVTSTITLPISLSVGTSGGGGGFTPTLLAIDGGPTYYASNGFSYATNSVCNGLTGGWDSPNFFPFASWLNQVTITADADRWVDIGWNVAYANTSDSLFSLYQSHNISFLIYTQEISLELATNTSFGTESVGIISFDEPESLGGSAISGGIIAPIAGSLIGSSTTGATNAIQDNRMWFTNFTFAGIPGGTLVGVPFSNVLNDLHPTPNATTRHINIQSIDCYWFVMSNNKCQVTGGTGGVSSTTLTVSGVTSGVVSITQVITGTGISGTCTVTAYGTGTGGTGTYTISPAQTISNGTTINGDTSSSQTQSDIYEGGQSAMTLLEGARGPHYGDIVDYMRARNPTSAPIFNYMETGNGKFQLNYNMRPFELDWAIWAQIIHGCRGIIFFDQNDAAGVQPFGGTGPKCNMSTSYFQNIQSGDIVSRYDQMKCTTSRVRAMAPVINAPFATGYVTCSPQRYVYPGVGTKTKAYAVSNGVDMMAKFYSSHCYIFATTNNAETDTNIAVTFTIQNSGATTVTRLYTDCVLNAVSNGAGGTRIRVASTLQMTSGDSAVIAGTAGVTGLNGTFSITVIDATHVDVALAFTGTLTLTGGGSGNGTISTTHDLSVTSGTTFSDTFLAAYETRIYRVN